MLGASCRDGRGKVQQQYWSIGQAQRIRCQIFETRVIDITQLAQRWC
jgi:hypothetical protein